MVLDGVLHQLETCKAGFKLLLTDTCRNDPQSSVTRSRVEAGLQSVSRPGRRPTAGLAALFSCSAGERAFESSQLKHGVFFHAVLEGLKLKLAHHEAPRRSRRT